MAEKMFYPRKSSENPYLKRMEETKITFGNKRQIEKKGIADGQSGQDHNDRQNSKQNKTKKKQQSTNCWSEKMKNYLCSWLFFLLAFVAFLLVWVIGHFSVERLADYYYFNDYNLSPYGNIQWWRVSQRATGGQEQKYLLSNSLYNKEDLKKADAIALQLLFSWVMWKLPLTAFTLLIIRFKSRSLQSYSTFGFFLALLLLIDIMVTIFRPEGYQEWIFFIIYVVLSIVLIVANNLKAKTKLLKSLKNFTLPIVYIALAYVSFCLLIPGVYGAIYTAVKQDAGYIIVHIFPVIDLAFYSLIVTITYIGDSHTIKFTKVFHFLNAGYALGHIMLFSPNEVEFYFLVGYFVVRNLTFNWIFYRVQKFVIVPCPQPGWIMVYLVSLAVNFVPFVGFGKLAVSKSYYTQILQLTLPILSYSLPQNRYSYSAQSLPEITTFNPSLNSNIQISSVFIFWVCTTITQKYHISKVEWKEVFYQIFGIYMFYFGLATGSQLYYLQLNSL